MTRAITGKVVLVTGAAGGPGAALCRRYARTMTRRVRAEFVQP